MKPHWLGFLSILFFFVNPAYAATVPFKVVIDPGHGGADYGTVSRIGRAEIAEKDVTLSLARNVAAILRRHGIRTVLTRSEDREVPLPARTQLANRLKADVFLSIHMNSKSAPSPSEPEGIETYILNNTTDASSKRLAHLENSVVNTSEEPGSTPMDIALILKDLRLDANLGDSKRLACAVQTELVGATSSRRSLAVRDRGVKQALFHVLLGADMPSVLVEAGFLSNPRDRAYVTSSLGQLALSRAIARAVLDFKSSQKSPRARFSLGRCKVN